MPSLTPVVCRTSQAGTSTGPCGDPSHEAGNTAPPHRSSTGTTQYRKWVPFQDSHPLYATHAHKRLPTLKYTRLLGRLPRRPAAGAELTADAEQYYAFVLAIFKAYRGSPVPPGMTLHQAYTDWQDNILPAAGAEYAGVVNAILDNIEADHACKDRRQEAHNQRRRELRARGVDMAVGSADSDGAASDAEDAPFAGRPLGSDSGEPDDGLDGDFTPDALPPPPGTLGILCQLDVQSLDLDVQFDRSNKNGRYAADATTHCDPPALPPGLHAGCTGPVLRPDTPPTGTRGDSAHVAALKRIVRRAVQYERNGIDVAGAAPADSHNARGSTPHRMFLRRATDRRYAVWAVVVTRGPDGLDLEQELPPGTLPPYTKLDHAPSIRDTVQLFNLSLDQAVAFMLMADYFTCRLSADPGEVPRLLLIGGPGTGKSQVVHALLWFTFQHGCPQWLATCAYAWAAALAFSTTVHRSLSSSTMFGLHLGDYWPNTTASREKVSTAGWCTALPACVLPRCMPARRC